MNGPGEPQQASTQGEPCGVTSFFPIGGASCRGRAEAFARRLQSRLRTLGSQDDDDDEKVKPPDVPTNPSVNGQASKNNNNNETPSEDVTDSQPPRLPSTEAADAFFDFDLDDEPESPGSPYDDCEYTRLIETAATTPQESAVPTSGDAESGYVCASPCSPNGSDDSNKSNDTEYFDPDASEGTDNSRLNSLNSYFDCSDSLTARSLEELKVRIVMAALDDDSSCTESLPPSQSTDSNLTLNPASSASSNTLQDVVMIEFSEPPQPPFEEEDEDQTLSVDEPLHINIEERPKVGRLPSIVETDEETEDESPRRIRRSSSLKSGKTPPGTPGRKKFVRFADVLGLDLADVKTFLDNEVPIVPKSAYEDLEYTSEPEIQVKFGPPVEKVLLPLFQQPGGLPNFLDKVREKQVCLENAAVTDPVTLTISGSVRVRNLDFHKSVYIRYTLDSWKSYSDLQCNYVEGTCDGFSDRFGFTLFGNSLQLGQRIEMALRFHCRGQQFWDNNYGSNYCFQCLPANQQIVPDAVGPTETAPANQPSPTSDFASGAFY